MSRAILVKPLSFDPSSIDRCKHPAGEEPAAVLADVPALVGRAARGRGRWQSPARGPAPLDPRAGRARRSSAPGFRCPGSRKAAPRPVFQLTTIPSGSTVKIAKSLMLSTISRRFSSASASACSTRLRWAISMLELAAAGLAARGPESAIRRGLRSVLDLPDHPADDRLQVIEKIGGLGNEVAHPGPQRLDQQLSRPEGRSPGWPARRGPLP